MIEIMIVVTLLGVLAIIAMPAVYKARMRTQNTAFVNDVRQLASAFEQCAITEGDYPADAAVGVMPTLLEPYAPRNLEWAESTAIGGHWNWERATSRSARDDVWYAGVEVRQPKRTSVQMQEIDVRLDDGNLATGVFRSKPYGYIYILE